MLATQFFKSYTDLVLKEHTANKYLHDLCIDLFSKTAIFDFSNIYEKNLNFKQFVMSYSKLDRYTVDGMQANLLTETMFIKVNQDTCIYLRDYKKDVITGCYYKHTKGLVYKVPITINTYLLENKTEILLNNAGFLKQLKDYEATKTRIYADVENTLNSINTLNKRTVLYDEPITNKATYYRYKDKTKGTIKINAKPIYIVLDKAKHIKNYKEIEKQGNIKYSFCFSVIGHWRKLKDMEHIGKDRHGEYNTPGFTWVKSYIKGDKNMPLIQKDRIIL